MDGFQLSSGDYPYFRDVSGDSSVNGCTAKSVCQDPTVQEAGHRLLAVMSPRSLIDESPDIESSQTAATTDIVFRFLVTRFAAIRRRFER